MTPDEYSARLNQLYTFVNGDIAEYILVAPGAELLAAIKERVSNKGKNTAGSNIGNYSTDPLYASEGKFVRKGAFVARGKNHFDGNTIGDRIIETRKILVDRQAVHQNNGTFLSGKQVTTSKGGNKKIPLYSLVKPDYQPRKTMYMDKGYKQLRDVQSLRTDIVNFKYSGQLLNDYQLQKIVQTVLLGITTDRSVKIFIGLTERFGDFYKPTDEEKTNYLLQSQYAINRLTRNTLQGYEVTAQIG